MISPISSSFSNLKSFSFITIIMLTHHNWWSTHYECYAALCQKWGCSAGSTAILTNREVRDPLRKKTALSGGKTEKNLSQFFLRLANTYKKYILQKNWVKAVIPALSSGRSNLQRPIWGCHRQLDDRDHLVGQLTRRAHQMKSCKDTQLHFFSSVFLTVAITMERHHAYCRPTQVESI